MQVHEIEAGHVRTGLGDSLSHSECGCRPPLSTLGRNLGASYSRFFAVVPASWPGDVGHPRLSGGTAFKTWMPGAGPGMTGGTSFPQPSKTSQHLRPDGDHSDKQGQRGQSSSFLDHGFEHDFVSSEQRENMVHHLF